MNLAEQLKAAIDARQRALDADQGGGMCDADGGHWTEDEVRRHLDADREILELHCPRETVYDVLQCEHCASFCHSGSGIMCEQPDAPYPCPTVKVLARGYGIEAQ